ncbi:MAG: hypothetical protein ACKOAD_04500 [Gammaproteobacteria bacterium]
MTLKQQPMIQEQFSLKKMIENYSNKAAGLDTVQALSEALEELALAFNALIPKHGTMDRQTFNLDFDLKNLKLKLQDTSNIDFALIQHEFKILLEQIQHWLETEKVSIQEAHQSTEFKINSKKSFSKKNQSNQNTTEAALNRDELLQVFNKTRNINIPYSNVPNPDSLKQVNSLITEQQETMNQLKLSTEYLHQVSVQADQAEKMAAQDQTQATEAARIAAELVLNTDLTASHQKNSLERLSQAICESGLMADRLGRTERIASEIMAAQAGASNMFDAAKNSSKSMKIALDVLNKNNTQDFDFVYDMYEQMTHGGYKLEQALVVLEDLNQYFLALVRALQAKSEQAKAKYAHAMQNQQEKEQAYRDAEQAFTEAQTRAIAQQNLVAEANQRAYISAKAAEDIRHKVKEALLAQQQAGTARAIAADKVRLAIQEASQWEE